jgi:hypothetical protein
LTRRFRGSVAKPLTSTVVLVGLWPPNHAICRRLTAS